MGTDYSDFNKLAQAVLAYRSSKALLVALRFDLFSRLARGDRTVKRLGRRLRLDPRALTILLNALCATGFLSRRGERYDNTPLTRRLLVAGSPHYKGNNLRYQDLLWEAWSDLGRVLQVGRPRLKLLDWLRRDAFTPDYIKAMHDIAQGPSAELARKLDWRGVRRMLDVGCGPGTYSAAFVRRRPGLEAVLFDLEDTLKVARTVLRPLPVPGTPGAGRPRPGRRSFVLRPGNYLEDDLGRREFDLILMSHVTHNECPRTNLRLIRKAFRALRPGGRLVIHDFVLDPGRATPRFSALFALHLLVYTGAGTTYTLAEYSAWLRKARFRGLRFIPIAASSINPSVAIVGRKP